MAKVSISATIDEALENKVKRKAKKERRSFSLMLQILVEKGLESEEKK
jgi:hypothetical protein